VESIRPWFRFAREAVAALADLLAPPHCTSCGRAAEAELCVACRFHLEPIARPTCARCGVTVAPSGRPCDDDHRAFAGLAAVRSAWRYRGVGGRVVRAFKFRSDEAARRLLIAAMLGRIDDLRTDLRRAVVVGVPRHRRKRRRRGADPGTELADAIGRAIGRPITPVLRRVRETLPQGDPRVMSREANVADAFAVVGGAAIRDRVVLLVDDVLTSGATARACAQRLLAAGARRVLFVSAARA
jgi:predicted amidophosphoribosyltransferase